MRLTTCIRCGAPCKVSGPGKDEATLLRLSAEPDGFCAGCAATQFVRLDYHFDGGLREKFDDNPALLLMPIWRECFANLLALGNSDADPAEIDWQRVVDNWGLPFPKKRKPSKPKAPPAGQESML